MIYIILILKYYTFIGILIPNIIFVNKKSRIWRILPLLNFLFGRKHLFAFNGNITRGTKITFNNYFTFFTVFSGICFSSVTVFRALNWWHLGHISFI